MNGLCASVPRMTAEQDRKAGVLQMKTGRVMAQGMVPAQQWSLGTRFQIRAVEETGCKETAQERALWHPDSKSGSVTNAVFQKEKCVQEKEAVGAAEDVWFRKVSAAGLFRMGAGPEGNGADPNL